MKYYYDCPIKAAYMAKEFGVVTVDDAGDVIGFGVMQWEARNDAEKERYYVHPDSLHIFTPKKFDIIVNANDAPFTVCTYPTAEKESYYDYITPRDAKWHFKNSPARWSILKRNNKAFIWPESE